MYNSPRRVKIYQHYVFVPDVPFEVPFIKIVHIIGAKTSWPSNYS